MYRSKPRSTSTLWHPPRHVSVRRYSPRRHFGMDNPSLFLYALARAYVQNKQKTCMSKICAINRADSLLPTDPYASRRVESLLWVAEALIVSPLGPARLPKDAPGNSKDAPALSLLLRPSRGEGSVSDLLRLPVPALLERWQVGEIPVLCLCFHARAWK